MFGRRSAREQAAEARAAPVMALRESRRVSGIRGPFYTGSNQFGDVCGPASGSQSAASALPEGLLSSQRPIDNRPAGYQPALQNFRNASTAFSPPKANEFDMAN